MTPEQKQIELEKHRLAAKKSRERKKADRSVGGKSPALPFWVSVRQ